MRNPIPIPGCEVVFGYGTIVQWSDDDSAFLAEVPELPGCVADGETYEEAIQSVKTVAREWIETAMDLQREVPKPRD